MSTGETIDINGTEIYCETSGDGEPLVLLHGFTGSGADWQQVFKEPLAGYRTIVPDLRGHGRSTNPSGIFAHRDAASDVLAVLNHLGIVRFKAIGMSTGGKTLLHAATCEPDRVDAMVLVSAAPYFPQQARTLFGQFTIDKVSEQEWATLRRRHRHGDAQIRELYRQGQAFENSYDDMNFTPQDLSTITARTLIVHGDRDPFYPVGLALEMYTAIPRSYLWVVPGGGHGPIFGERAAGFVENAGAFLRGELE